MVKRKSTKLVLLLTALADYEWHWADELATKVGWRFGATIKEARYKNYDSNRSCWPSASLSSH
jgi:hypothetical protein